MIVILHARSVRKMVLEPRWLFVDDKGKNGVGGKQQRWQVVENIELAANLTQYDNEQQVTNLWCSFYHNITIQIATTRNCAAVYAEDVLAVSD